MNTTMLQAALLAIACAIFGNAYASKNCDEIADKQQKVKCLNRNLEKLQDQLQRKQEAEKRAQERAQRETQERAQREAQDRARQDQQRQQQQAEQKAQQKAQERAQREAQDRARQDQQRQQQQAEQKAQQKAQERAQREAQDRARQDQQRQQQQAQQKVQQNQQQVGTGRCDNIADKQQKVQCLNKDLQGLQEQLKKQQAAEQRAQQDAQRQAQQREQQLQARQREQQEAQRQAQLKAQQDQQRQQQQVAQQKAQPVVQQNQQQIKSGRCDSIADKQQKLQCLNKELQALQEQQRQQQQAEQQKAQQEAQRQAQLKAQQDQQRQQQQMVQQKTQPVMQQNQQQSKSGRCDSISDPQQKLQCLRQNLDSQQQQQLVQKLQFAPPNPAGMQPMSGFATAGTTPQINKQLFTSCGSGAILRTILQGVEVGQAVQNVVSFNAACDAHDACYGDRGSSRSKADCDNEFAQIATEICNGATISKSTCLNQRDIFYLAVSKFGGEAFCAARGGINCKGPIKRLIRATLRAFVPEKICISPAGNAYPLQCPAIDMSLCLSQRKSGNPNGPCSTLVSFNSAHNNHDACYRTHGTTKSRCDAMFYADLKNACRSELPSSFPEAGRKKCYELAIEYNDHARNKGCEDFKDAQILLGGPLPQCT